MSLEITYKELKDLPKEQVLLVDIRDHSAVGYGMLPGAVHIPQDELSGHMEEFSGK